jgi:hypothetical protein
MILYLFVEIYIGDSMDIDALAFPDDKQKYDVLHSKRL